MLTNFLTTLNSISPISQEASEHLQKVISLQRLPKGTLLLAEGQISDKLFFLCKGMARAFYYEKGNEITSWIVSENDFIYSTASFIQQKPSFETIQLLKDTKALTISMTDKSVRYFIKEETSKKFDGDFDISLRN